MTYDAVELQDMRDRRDFLSANDVLALIDALEKAQGEALCPDCQTVHDQLRTQLTEVEAERDSARALLGETSDWLYEHVPNTGPLRARIAKELAQ